MKMLPEQRYIPFRDIGQRLRKFRLSIDEDLDPNTTILSALADILGEHIHLLPPLQDLVSKPRFLAHSLEASSTSSSLLKDGLITELRMFYNDEVLESLSEVLNGYLGLESGLLPIATATESLSDAPNEQTTLVLGGQLSATGTPSKKPDRPGFLSQLIKKRPHTHKLNERKNSISQDKVLIAIAMTTTVLTITWKSALPCRLFGYCPEQFAVQGSAEDLRTAQQAIKASELANSLDELDAAVKTIGESIAKLERMPLTDRQRSDLLSIQKGYISLSKRFQSEATNGALIQKASARLEASTAEQGQEKQKLVTAAKNIFEKIELVENSIFISDYTRLKQGIATGGASQATPTVSSAATAISAPSRPSPPTNRHALPAGSTTGTRSQASASTSRRTQSHSSIVPEASGPGSSQTSCSDLTVCGDPDI